MTASTPAFAPRARLLVIEHDEAIARGTAAAFAACFVAQPETVDVRGGREAGEALRSERFDLVLADLDSICDLAPSTDLAVARLAKLGGTALTIILSEDASVSAAVIAMRSGAHDVIGKRPEPGLLAERIGRLCQRHGRPLGLVVEGIEATQVATLPAVLGVGPVPYPHQVLPMWRQEQKIIEEAIASFAGNIALAAAALELSPSTIYRKRQAWAEAETERRGAA